jgi:uncharacterized phiE125 gp8 family phage protein
MTMVMEAVAAGALDGAVVAAKALLRIDSSGEDGLIETLVRAALDHAEAFTGQVTIRRDGAALVPARADWARLPVTPVQVIGVVHGVPAEGAAFALAIDAYAIDIDAQGDGWVRVMRPGSAGRIEVAVRAGMAETWGTLPEALRQGVVRLAAHLFTDRDGTGAPPAAVTALWRPWRRMRLL